MLDLAQLFDPIIISVYCKNRIQMHVRTILPDPDHRLFLPEWHSGDMPTQIWTYPLTVNQCQLKIGECQPERSQVFAERVFKYPYKYNILGGTVCDSQGLLSPIIK